MNVLLVEVGEYSSASIIAVFDEDRRADAEELARLTGGQVYEPMPLNGTKSLEQVRAMIPVGATSFYCLRMKQDGTVPPGEVFERSLIYAYPAFELNEQVYEVHQRRNRPSKWRLAVNVYASSLEHAVKIANDLRIQILAGAKPMKGNLPC